MKTTNDQIDKLTELCLTIAQQFKSEGITYDGLLAACELQIGKPRAEWRKLDALTFAFHTGYLAGKWWVLP